MKILKYFFLFLLMSCSSSKVMTDDDTINFSDFKTYEFYEGVGKSLNELDVKRIKSTINLELKQLGFTTEENPAFFINVISKISEKK